MAIQSRRGAYEDFDPTKLLPGEWADVLTGDPNASDGRAVYKCFAAGVVKRMATFEDMSENIDAKTASIIQAAVVALAEEVAHINAEALPDMSANQRGIAKLGSGLSMSNSALSVDIEPADIGAYTATETDEAIAAAQVSVYKAKGSLTFANLPRTLTASMEGFVYNIEDSFTIDNSVKSIFVEQSGTFPAGTNVVVINVDTTGQSPTYKYDVVAGFVDLSGYAPTVHNHSGQAITPASVAATGDVTAVKNNKTYSLGSLGESVSPIGGISASDNTEVLKKIGQWLVTHLGPYQSKASQVSHSGQWQGFVTGCVLSSGNVASYIVFNYGNIYLCYYKATDDSVTVKTVSFV